MASNFERKLSSPYERKTLSSNPSRTWKSLAKFSKAVKKISNFLPMSPSSKLQYFRSSNSTTPSYSPELSLYECSCEYHDSLRKQLNNNRLSSKVTYEKSSNFCERSGSMHGDVHAKKRFQRSKTDQFFISDAGGDDEDDDDDDDDDKKDDEETKDNHRFPLVEALDCAAGSTGTQLKGVNRRAEEFIQKFWEEQRIQRQQSIEEFYEMLNRGT